MRNGFRGDLILLALILSAAAHIAAMLYAEQKVMIHVADGGAKASRHGPMRVSEAVHTPDPLKLDVVRDIEPDRSAPEAVEAAALVPSVETALPEPKAGEAALQPPLPNVDSVEASAVPPPVMTALPDVHAPVTRRETKADLPAAPSASAMPSAPPSSTVSDLPAAPVFEAPAFSPTPSLGEGSAAGRGSIALIVPKKEVLSFTPPTEVMAAVNEKIVNEEKAAVKALVNVADAKELARFVNVRMKRFTQGAYAYFRVAFSPKAELPTIPKDVVILIDASGSIGKDRMGSIRNAAKDILRSAANTGDRFNLVAFRDRYSYAFKSWQECTARSFDAADRWLSGITSFGRTDVFATISSVLTLPRDPSRPLIALLVTDGDANAGVSETSEILSKFTALNDGLVSIYTYGVKSSANRELIDVLTHGNRGESLIFDGWRWKAGTGMEKLTNRFRDPVLSDIRVVFASGSQAETYPRLLKNLYRGETVEFVGRVAGTAMEIAFSVRGLNGGDAYESFFRLSLTEASEDPGLVAAWEREKSIDKKIH